MADDLGRAKYISFTSYRADGTPVATPVWVVPFEDGYAFTTDSDSYKVKRVLRDSSATVQVCSVRGRAARDAPSHRVTATVLPSERVDEVRRLVKKKYPIAYALLISWSDRRAARREGSPTAGTAAIKFVLS